MVTPKSAEERLRALYLVVAAVSVAAMAGLGFTAMRGPGLGYVLVFAGALVTAAGLGSAVVYRRRRARRWPPYRRP